MNCARCGKNITPETSYSYEGKNVCEDCFIELGLHPKGCEPWATYIATHTPGGAGPKSKQGLTELQKEVRDFIKSRGKVPRDEVMTNFKFSEADLDAQMATLFNSELVKETREGNKVYLVSIS